MGKILLNMIAGMYKDPCPRPLGEGIMMSIGKNIRCEEEKLKAVGEEYDVKKGKEEEASSSP